MAATFIDTVDLRDGILAASSAGRAKIASAFFDVATVDDKFASNVIKPAKLKYASETWDFSTATALIAPTPTAATHVTTKGYVDSLAAGLDVKASVRLATAAALPAVTPGGSGVGKTLTADEVGVLTVDGVATVLNDRILVKNQSSAIHNGIYKVTTEGTGGAAFVLTRATDADENTEVTAGMFTFVEQGSTNDNDGFVLSTNTVDVDVTSQDFSQFSAAGGGVTYVAGAGMTESGGGTNTFDVVSANSAIVVNANDLALTLNATNPGLVISTGLLVKNDVTTSTQGNIVRHADGIYTAVDGVGIETASFALRLKDAGVLYAKLATAVSERLGGYDRREDFVGDGSTTVFTLSQTDAKTTGGGHHVTQGGLSRKSGAGNDYTISATAVTFLTAPPLNANISVWYQRTGSAL